MDLDVTTVRNALEALDRRDPKRRLHGAWEHVYQLNPPLPLGVLEAFEAEHGITLPEDYKYFLTTIGNGGAGPAYGLLSFGEYDEGVWSDGRLVGDVGQPFPYAAAWNLPESFWSQEPDLPSGTPVEEEDRLLEAWHAIVEREYWNPQRMNGAIPICHRGCALRQWLVVHGLQRGYVWNDDRADCAGVSPLTDAEGQPMTFRDWYIDWLEKAPLQDLSHPRDWLHENLLPEWVFLLMFVAGLVGGTAVGLRFHWPRHLPVFGGVLLGAAAAIATGQLDRLLLALRRRCRNRSRNPRA